MTKGMDWRLKVVERRQRERAQTQFDATARSSHA